MQTSCGSWEGTSCFESTIDASLSLMIKLGVFRAAGFHSVSHSTRPSIMVHSIDATLLSHT